MDIFVNDIYEQNAKKIKLKIFKTIKQKTSKLIKIQSLLILNDLRA